MHRHLIVAYSCMRLNGSGGVRDDGRVERQVQLDFTPAPVDFDTPADLSAVCRDGPWLWLAGDESPRLERLTLDPTTGTYADHQSYPLGALVDLPKGATEEVDVEGMDRHG